MTEANVALAVVRDHALWLAHISGDAGLVAELSSLNGGATVELTVDGQFGTWKKLDDGVDGRRTQALKPMSYEAKRHWHSLQDRRGTSVTVSRSIAPSSGGAQVALSIEATHGLATSARQVAFIAKIDPVSIPSSGKVLVTAPVYGETPPAAGATVYLWFSETNGGNGLARRGIIVAAEDGTKPSLLVELDAARVLKALGKNDIAPHRDSLVATPLSGLARKLFKHSPNKVTTLAADEEAFLASRMVVPPTSAATAADLAIAELERLENVPGDGRRMFADTALYRLTTINENVSVDQQTKPGTLRGAAAEFIRAAGGQVVGRDLHLHMVRQRDLGNWDYGYVHSARAKERDWIRQV